MKSAVELLTLYRPVGPQELALIEASGWKAFPPRLPEQPIFYPVTNEEYATQIARDWNVRQSGAGFVTRFQVRADFATRYPVHKVGGAAHTELWVPANDLAEFNRNIVGNIQVIAEFR
jgi:hypothetical protein